jgi:ribosomal protein S18 acetylase RimI-like enzyme
MGVEVRLAKKRDLKAVKKLADGHRRELGFVRLPTLQQAVNERRIFVALLNPSPASRPSSRIIGFVHFRCCKDGHATIYEIAVAPEWRGNGVGKALVQAVINEAKKQGCSVLRLKCPVDLPANGFYHRLGFVRIGIETPDGNRRPLAIWQFPLNSSHKSLIPSPPIWQFYVGLTSDASHIRALIRRFFEGYNFQPPFNPFERIIVSPLFVPPAALRLLHLWRTGERTPVPRVPCPVSLIFDSGGYQVQIGKLTYDELCRQLRELYGREKWADFYVLPDHVPTSRDTDGDVERKIKETLTMGELFLRWLGWDGNTGHGARDMGKVIGVVHGRTVRQVIFAARKWHELGVNYVAFGSFGTSGPKGSVNMLSKRSLKLLKALAEETAVNGQKLHIFGIGSPTYLLRLKEEGIEPTSFDSTGWWKAGGFGSILLPGSKQWHISDRKARHWSTVTVRMLERLMQKVGHRCPFCGDLRKLRERRWLRVLHNLVIFGETVTNNLNEAKRQTSEQ